MEMAAVGESNGGGNCMVARGACTAPVELRPQDTVAETGDKPAEQQCEHFSIRGYVALVQKKEFCSLSQIFHDQQQYDEHYNSSCPFSVAKFRRWDCLKCLDKVKNSDHRTTSRTVSMKQDETSDSCSISFVRSVDTKRLFPCTQQSSQGKNADRTTLPKSAQESNSKCSSPSSGRKGVTEANTDSPTKDLQGSSYNHDATANISDNASVDVTTLPKVSQIRANKEGNGTEIPCKPKLSEVTLKPNADENGKTQEILIVDCNMTNGPKPIPGPKGALCNSGPRAKAASKGSVESNCKKKKDKKYTALVGAPKLSEVTLTPNADENGKTHEILIVDCNMTNVPKPIPGQKGDEVCNSCSREEAASKESVESNCKKKKDNKPTAQVGAPKLSEVTLTPNADENGKIQEILIVDCNMTNVPKPIPGQEGDQICNNGPREEAASKRSVESNSKKKKVNKPTAQVGGPDVKICRKKPKKLRLLSEIINTGQVGRSRSDIEVDHGKVADLCDDDRSRDDITPVSNHTVGQIWSKTTKNKTKYKGVDAVDDHGKVADLCEDDRSRDDITPVSNHTVGQIRSKTTKNKTKYKGVDAVDDRSSLMNWLKRTHNKLRTEKKDSEHKDFDSCAANSKSTVDIFVSKDMHQDFLSSAGNLSKKKMLTTISTQRGDENIQNNNLEINRLKTDDMRQIESDKSTLRRLSKANTMSLSKGKMPSTANVQHGDENTENDIGKRTILRTDDQCQMESRNSMQRCLSKVSLGKRDIQNVTGEHKLPKKRKKQKLEPIHEKHKQKLEPIHEKQTIIDDIPMDIVELLARNQHERQLMTETDSFDISQTQSKMIADDDCPIVAANDGPNYASTVLDTNFQQKSLASESNQKALQVHVASSTQATSTHPPKLQIPCHLKSTQEQQPHLRMEVVTIAASSPIFSQHKDQYIAEAPAESWSHRGTRKVMWDSFKAAPRDSSIAACGSQFRPNIRAVDLTSTHETGASNNYPTHQPVITALDHCTKRAVNQVQARSFPSAISTMEAGNLYDRRNAGQSGFYPKETMPATHLLRLMDSSTLAGFPNYETSNGNQMEFQLRNSQYTHNQYKGSTSTSYGSNLNGKVPLTLEDLSRHKLQPLTLEDSSRHQLQPNLQRPLRPHPRVGVLPSFLQEEIANWSENCGTQSGYRIGVSKGITSFDMNKKENFEALNSGMFSAKWNALQLGSVSSNSEYLSARNSIAQSWTRGKGKMTHPLDKFVKQDICVTNRNPADLTAISDDNEYMMNL